MKKIVFILLLSLFSTTLFAETYFCQKELETLPILQGGRIKPLYVHASEVMKNLTGKSTVGNYSAVEAYCLLSLHSLGMPSDLELNARIDHVDLMKFLGLPKGEHSISYEQLLSKMEDLRNEAQNNQKNESYSTAIGKLWGNIAQYQEIKEGKDWMLAKAVNNQVEWQPLVTFLGPNKDNALTRLMQTKTDFDSVNKTSKYSLELTYAKAGLAHWALLFSILALAALVMFQKNFKITLGLASTAVVLEAIHITMRVFISGRAPITNMYETVLFSGFGSLILSLALYAFKKEKLYVYMGLAYNVCTLMMLSFANGMLSATISPLVPVLRDNFWLSTHVTSIILSYGALALSWIMANTVLIKRKWGKINSKEVHTYSDIIYTTLKWGTTLLAAGIILGGVWADYSWGRFWGWDPKETWSLIVLCIYMAILHGRYTTWIKQDRFITVTAGAFMSVMMAWFGVNYILASGLHSYGFSAGGAVFLFTFFALQIALIVATTIKTEKVSTGEV